MPSNESIYNWLAQLGIGYVRWQQLKKLWQDLQVSEAEAWEAVVREKETFSLSKKILSGVQKHHQRFGRSGWLAFLSEQGIKPICLEDSQYPVKLLKPPQPPPILYIQSVEASPLQLLDKPMLGVVGTRHPTPSGEHILKKIVSGFLDVAGKTVVIASGMMYGIDEIAHRQALAQNGPTLAVLGAGLLWQKHHDATGLFHDIRENAGLLISQFHPEVSPQKGTFVARNTTLAGLSDAVLVGEAHMGSGSRHTVAAAARLNKPIWTIPVHSSHAAAAAVVELVNKNGVKLLINEQPLNHFFGIAGGQNVEAGSAATHLDSFSQNIVTALQSTPMTFEKLVHKTALLPSKLTEMLIKLELAGTIERRGPEWLLVNMKQLR